MGILNQMKEAVQMRKDAKRIQAEIDKISYTHNNGGISITMKGDFTVQQVKIQEDALAEVRAGRTERFETMLKNVINGATNNVRQLSQQALQQMMKDAQ